jgi:hypothetical protein
MKTCKKCGETKPFEDFKPAKANKDGLSGSCRTCYNLVWRAWYESSNNKASNAERNKKFYESPLGKQRLREKRLARYGLDEATFALLDSRSHGLCETCKKVPHEVIDHDHSTGKVRGLLCGPCNRGIGIFGDSVEKLEAAIKYLQQNTGS